MNSIHHGDSGFVHSKPKGSRRAGAWEHHFRRTIGLLRCDRLGMAKGGIRETIV